MVCVNQTRLRCVNQMGKTQCKALVERHGICELALMLPLFLLLGTRWYPLFRKPETKGFYDLGLSEFVVLNQTIVTCNFID
jgi:hypothetical protein